MSLPWHDHSSRGWGQKASRMRRFMRSLFFVFSKRWGQTPPVMLYHQGIPWEWLREAAPQSLPIVAGFHCSLCDSLKGAEPDDVLGLSPCEGSAALTNLLEF